MTAYFRFGTYRGSPSQEWLDYDQTTVPAMKAMLECFVGQRIGGGTTRTVFQCKHDPSKVIKIQSAYEVANQMEFRVWEKFGDDPKVGKWLAPVHAISADGRVIVQSRTLPLINPPKKIPDFLSDLKVQNFGMLDGRVVAHDYGLGIFIDSNSPIEMVAPEWWDGFSGDHYG